MIKYGNLALLQFPKMERYALAGDIKRSMYKILELVIRANKARNKKPLLYEIDVELDILRTFIRLAADFHIQTDRDNALELEPLEVKTVSFEPDRNGNLYEQAYNAAKSEFVGWEDDIVTEETEESEGDIDG